MNEIEYALKIVLKARDDLATGLGKAKAELEAFKREVNGMNTGLNTVNTALKEFDGHIDGITQKLEAWRDTLRNSGDDSDKASKSVAKAGKEIERTAAKTKVAIKTSEDLSRATKELGETFTKVSEDFQKGKAKRSEYIDDLNEIAKSYNKLAGKAGIGNELARSLRAAGNMARTQAKMLTDADKAAEESAKKRNETGKKTVLTQKALQQQASELRRQLNDLNLAHRKNSIESGFAAKEYTRLSTALQKLVVTMSDASRKRTPADVWATQATEAAAHIKQVDQEITADAKAERDKRTADIKNELGEITSAVKKFTEQRSAGRRNEEREAEESARKQAETYVYHLEKQRKAEEEASKAVQAATKLAEENDKRRANSLTGLREKARDLNRVFRDIQELEDKQAVSTRYAAEQYKILGDEINRIYKGMKAGTASSQEVSRYADNIKQASQKIVDANRAKEESDREAAKSSERDIANQKEAIRLATRMEAIHKRSREGKLDLGDTTELKAIAKDYDRLAEAVKDNNDEFRKFSTTAARIRNVISGMGDGAKIAEGRFAQFAKALGSSSDNVATLDNRLRGIILLAVASFAEQLITVVTALGGELVALAGSAAMAGGALGGILAAGAAQALPVVGLLAGAMSRVNSVMEAFQQNQKLQQAIATDAEKSGQKTIDKTNALASAQDQVTAANERLAESRKGLNKAQKEGVEQLEDLAQAERDAALAAKGASLNVKDAQKALSDAIANGATALEIQHRQQDLDEARNSARKARVGERRATAENAAVGGDIGNLESVQNAQKQVKDAQRAVDAAGRGLDAAGDKAQRAAATTMTAAATLNYLLSQMSPAERKLYTALNRIYKDYQKIFIGDKKKSGIYGTIISAFADAVNAVDKIMKMPRVIKTLQGLSSEIAKQIRKVTKFLTRGEELEQFLQITNDAKKNLGPLVDIVIDLADAFTDIATAANPAFEQLLEYIGPIVDKFLGVTSDKGKMEDFFLRGEEHLESWLKLFGAIGGLLGALFGASADTGKKGVEDLTARIKEWTDWIEGHHDQVVKFFQDAYDVVKSIGKVAESVAEAIAKIFTPEHVEEFTQFLENTLIPALTGVITTLGDITDKFLLIVNTPVGGMIVKLGLMALIFGQIATSAIGVAGHVKTMVKHFTDLGKALGNFATGKGKDGIDALDDLDPDKDKKDKKDKKKSTTRDKDGKRKPVWADDDDDDKGKKKPGIFDKIKGFGKKAAPSAAGGAAAAAAPVAATAAVAAAPFLAIAAAVALAIGAIVLLLDHFDKLDDVWNAVKQAFEDFMEDIQPSLDKLGEALDGLGIHVTDVSDIVTGFWDVLEGVADFISVYLVEAIKGLGKVFSGTFNAIIYIIAGAIEILQGLADIIIGAYTLDWDQFKKGIGGIVDGFVDLGLAILDGVGKVLEGMTDIFLAPFKGAWAAIKKWFGISSPSKRAASLGEAILDGVKDGLRGLLHALTWPFRMAWRGVLRFFGKERVENLANDIIDFFSKGLRSGAEAVKRAATWVWGRIKEAFNAAKNFGGTIVTAIVDGIKSLPGKMLEAVTTIGKDLAGIGKAIGGFIVDGIKSVVDTAKKFIPFWGDDEDKDGKKPSGGGTEPAKPAAAPTVKFDIGVGAIPFGAKDLDSAQNIYGEFWKELRKTARDSTDYIQRQFRDMRIATTDSSDKMYKDIRASLADIQNSFKVRGEIIGDTWSDRWQNINKVAYDSLNYIGHQTNLMLKGLAEKNINFGLAAPAKTDQGGKAGGGWIGNQGERGKDSGLFRLGRGEAVLNWQHQPYVEAALNAQYGFGLGGLFNRVKGFHAGGPGQQGFAAGGIVPIPGSPGEFIHNSILKDVVYLRDKYKLHISDGYALSGHAAGGEHPKGLAIDAGPNPAAGGSWDIVDQLAHWAEPSQNNPRSPFRWVGYDGDPNHGRNNHIHLSWAAGKTLGAVGDIVTSIAKRMISGPNGGFKNILQSVTDKIRHVANKFVDNLSTAGGTEGSESYSNAIKVPENLQDVNKTYPSHIGPKAGAAVFSAELVMKIAQAAGLPGRLFEQIAHGESGYSPGIQQPDPGDGMVGYGLWQNTPNAWGKGSEAYKFMMSLGGIAAMFNPFKNARMAKFLYDRAASKNPNSPGFPWFGTGYVKSGGGFAEFAEGGIIPGGDGMPVPILAHAGEWVLNKGQQLRAAMMAGLSVTGLRSMLGFHGGPDGADGGTEVRAGAAPVIRKPRIDRGIGDLNKLLDTIDKVFAEISQQSAIANAQLKAKAKPGKVQTTLGKAIDSIDKLINGITGDAGVVGQINNNFQRVTRALARATYQIKNGVVTKNLSDPQILAKQLDNLEKQASDLLGEKSNIQKGIAEVNKLLKNKNISKAQRQQLEGQRKLLLDGLDAVNQAIVDNTESRFQQQLAIQQKIVDDINTKADDTAGGLDLEKRIAMVMGGTLVDINKRIGMNLETQRAELLAALPAAKAAGASDLVKQITKDVAELDVQIKELAAQSFQDSIDSINKAASRKMGHLDLFTRMADAVGAIGGAVGIPSLGNVPGMGAPMTRGQIFEARGKTLEGQRGELQGKLREAASAGYLGKVDELTDQLAELDVTIAENTKAASDAKKEEAAATFDYNMSINDLKMQLLDATDAISNQTSTSDKLILLGKKDTLLTERHAELLQQQKDTPSTDEKAMRDLEKQLLENEIATAQNTKAINDVTGAGSAPQTFSSVVWDWVGQAFFGGTGEVIPDYALAGGSSPTFTGGVGNIGLGSSTTNSNGDTYISVEVNEAGQPIDGHKIASNIGFAQSTAP